MTSANSIIAAPTVNTEIGSERVEPAARATGDAVDELFTPGRFALVLLALLAAAYPDVVFQFQTFCFRDFGYFGYPLAHYHRESFWRGEIPLWNPLSNCGLPFLAQWNTLVLYPGSLIYLLLPLPWSLSAFCLAHLFWAGMAMYWLAHRWTGHRLAACVAGLAYAFNGLSLNCLMWPNNVAGLAWMPLVVLFVERAWREGGRMIFLAAFIGALLMLSGAPEIILFNWGFLGLLAFAQIFRSRAARANLLWRFPLVVLLVVGLCAAQLLPFLDLLKHSQRSESFANADWAMPPAGWANFIVPLFQMFQNRQGIFFQHGQFWTSSYYLGLGILALATFALWRVRERRVWFLGAIIVVSCTLALGDQGHLYTWLRAALPQFGFIRFPIKFIVLAVFAVPLLAAFAIRHLQNLPAEQTSREWQRAAAMLAGWLTISVVIARFAHRYPSPEYDWNTTWKSAASRVAFMLALFGILLSLRFVRRREMQWLARLGLFLCLAFDAFTHAPRQNPTVSCAVLEPGMGPLKALQPLPRHGASRAMITPEADLKLRYSNSSKPLTDYICSRLGLFSNCNLLEEIPKLNGFYSLYLREASEITSLLYATNRPPLPALHDFLGVSQITRSGEYFEWTNRTSFMPLATIGQQPIFLSDTATLAALSETSFNPQAVVLLPPEAKSHITVTNRAEAEVLESHFAAQHATIEISARQPALLVVAQAFYHPWRAYVDDRPTRIWRANYGFQAIEVPAGRHAVKLAYEDKQFSRGVEISLLTCGFCAIGGMAMARKRREN
ncbi:MAG: YfhO family protein [Verrucomicrobia bacterium]|nr:YfhO family protein [Verrucomicrobiota bacterium]